jgi:hypothetical protein
VAVSGEKDSPVYGFFYLIIFSSISGQQLEGGAIASEKPDFSSDVTYINKFRNKC